MTHPFVSAVAFYLCWFACVGGAARGVPWLGPLAVALYAAAYLRTIPSGPHEAVKGRCSCRPAPSATLPTRSSCCRAC